MPLCSLQSTKIAPGCAKFLLGSHSFMNMESKRKEAWKALKTEVDKFYQSTGAEVVVATTCLPDPSNINTYPVYGESTRKPACYGYGSLWNQVKDLISTDDKSNNSHDDNSQDILLAQSKIPGQGRAGQPVLHENISSSFSDNFRTLKLDLRSEPLYSGASGSTIASGRVDPTEYHGQPVLSHNGKRKSKRKKTKKQPQLDELEFDEGLLFDEKHDSSEDDNEDSDDSFDDTDDSDEDAAPSGRIYRVPEKFDRSSANVAFATSLPVNINLNWGPGGLSERQPRFRDNQGPHPPFYNPPTRSVAAAQAIVQPDKTTPHLETMRASMQALARSVTNDSASIFGDRPRPRTQAENPGGQIKF